MIYFKVLIYFGYEAGNIDIIVVIGLTRPMCDGLMGLAWNNGFDVIGFFFSFSFVRFVVVLDVLMDLLLL